MDNKVAEPINRQRKTRVKYWGNRDKQLNIQREQDGYIDKEVDRDRDRKKPGGGHPFFRNWLQRHFLTLQ